MSSTNLKPSSNTLFWDRCLYPLFCRWPLLIAPVIGLALLTYWLLSEVHLVLPAVVTGIMTIFGAVAFILSPFTPRRKILAEFHGAILRRVLFVRHNGLLPDGLIDQSRPPKNLKELLVLSRAVDQLLPQARRMQWQTRIDWLKANSVNPDIWPRNEHDRVNLCGDSAFMLPLWAVRACFALGVTFLLTILLADCTLSFVAGADEDQWFAIALYSFICAAVFLGLATQSLRQCSYHELHRRMTLLVVDCNRNMPIPDYTENYSELYRLFGAVNRELRSVKSEVENNALQETWSEATGS